jgi:hypothetical protein
MIEFVEVTIELSTMCPYSCQHCSTWFSSYYDKDSDGETNELSVEKVIDIAIEYIKGLKGIPVVVRFSGGEPMIFLETQIFVKVLKECDNISGWIIATSGAMSFKDKFKSYNTNFGGVKNLSYRMSLYGNKEEHTLIMRNYEAFDYLIENADILKNANIPFEFSTPIFFPSGVYHAVQIGKQFGVPVRLFRLLATPNVEPLHQVKQLWISRCAHLLYKKAYLTCSLYGECKTRCAYPKATVLATGKIIGCAMYKMKNMVV